VKVERVAHGLLAGDRAALVARDPRVEAPWLAYDCDHGVDGHPHARLDRYAFIDEVLA
jgi:hypothetical protein